MVTGGSNKLKMERPVDLTDEVIRLQIGNRTDPAAKSLDRSRSEQIGLDRSRSARVVAARFCSGNVEVIGAVGSGWVVWICGCGLWVFFSGGCGFWSRDVKSFDVGCWDFGFGLMGF